MARGAGSSDHQARAGGRRLRGDGFTVCELEGSGRDVCPRLVDTIERYKMPTRYLHDLISGAEMDLTIQTYPSFERLKEYCYRVAGTVGLTCTHIFGFHDFRALDLAEKLGLAFQLTNIIRDVQEDYGLGPRLFAGGGSAALSGDARKILARSEASLGVRELLRFEAERAWKLYEEGAAVARNDRRRQPGDAVAAGAHV